MVFEGMIIRKCSGVNVHEAEFFHGRRVAGGGGFGQWADVRGFWLW